MKDKTITLTPRGISQKQWSTFLLELNLMKKAWKPFGVNVEIKASGLKNVLKWGTTIHGPDNTKRRSVSSRRSYEGDDSQYSNG